MEINALTLLSMVLVNQGGRNSDEWLHKPYTASWKWPHVFVDIANVDGDGSEDIILAAAEPAGGRYRLSWFSNGGTKDDYRIEIIVENNLETARHFVGAADMDNDGDADIVSAATHQGEGLDSIEIYYNKNRGRKWSRRFIRDIGSQSMRILDVDGDSDWDLFGANWSGKHQEIVLWENLSCQSIVSVWIRREINSERPWKAIFVYTADMDSDGLMDVVSGAWWYRNLGRLAGKWERNRVGENANNVAAVLDFDGDQHVDILATTGRGAGPSSHRVWARNSGTGTFRVRQNIARGKGDFLQGVASGQFTSSRNTQIALSWHSSGTGVQFLSVPEEPLDEE